MLQPDTLTQQNATAAGALSRNPLGELTALPNALDGFKGARRGTGERREGKLEQGRQWAKVGPAKFKSLFVLVQSSSAEGYGNGDQRRPMGHVAREGLYFTFYFVLVTSLSRAGPLNADVFPYARCS